jgi:hypothetical protein
MAKVKKNIVKKVVTSVAEFINLMKNAKAGGQLCWVYGKTDYNVNKYPTGTTPKERCPELAFRYSDVDVKRLWHVQFNFAADYDARYEKVVGEEHNSHDENRRHLVKNVVMTFLSTGNVCLIVMPNDRINDGIEIDGRTATEEEVAYCELYKRIRKPSTIPYMNPSLRNIYKLSVNGVDYEVNITDLTYEEEEAYAVAVAQ